MKRQNITRFTGLLVALVASGSLAWQLNAADSKEDAIKEFMKACHKAPKGTDPTCKKAANGEASKDELKRLIEGYQMMCSATPSKGDAASWKEKTTKLLTAAKGLQKGGPDALAAYKEAVNCKACHSVHKPD